MDLEQRIQVMIGGAVIAFLVFWGGVIALVLYIRFSQGGF